MCSFHEPRRGASLALAPMLLVPTGPTPGLERSGDRDPASQPQSLAPVSTSPASPPVILHTPTEVGVLKPFCTPKRGSERVGGCTRVTQHSNDVEMGLMG